MNTTATHAQRRMIDTGAARIEVISRGAGALVILLPSLGRAAEDFDDLATRVAQAGYQVLTPQPRGLGASVGPMQNITLHDYARDMAVVINAYGGGPAVIGGHAFGNFVARTTAADHPALVKAIMLIAALIPAIVPVWPRFHHRA